MINLGQPEVKLTDISSYREYFNGSLPRLADYYALRCSESEKRYILCAFIDGVPCGALFCGQFEECRSCIIYAAVLEDYRRKGVCAKLLHEALAHFKALGFERVQVSNTMELTHGAVMDAFLRKNGFNEVSRVINVVNHYNSTTIAEYHEFMERRGNKIIGRLINRGYSIKSFKDATAQELALLEGDMGTKYPADLNPFTERERIIDDISFIVLKGAYPIAFCALTLFDDTGKTLLISKMASSSDYMNTAAALCALMKSLEASLKGEKYTRAVFSYDDKNINKASLNSYGFTLFRGHKISETKIYSISLKEF